MEMQFKFAPGDIIEADYGSGPQRYTVHRIEWTYVLDNGCATLLPEYEYLATKVGEDPDYKEKSFWFYHDPRALEEARATVAELEGK